jgi:hypothetical protein
VWRFGTRPRTDSTWRFGTMPTPEPGNRPTFNAVTSAPQLRIAIVGQPRGRLYGNKEFWLQEGGRIGCVPATLSFFSKSLRLSLRIDLQRICPYLQAPNSPNTQERGKAQKYGCICENAGQFGIQDTITLPNCSRLVAIYMPGTPRSVARQDIATEVTEITEGGGLVLYALCPLCALWLNLNLGAPGI